MNKKLKLEIRQPRMSDLDSLLKIINSLVEEKAMITVQKKLTRKEEEKYLKGIIKDKNTFHLFLVVDGEVMGSGSIVRFEGIRSHVGELGISIKKEARGKGLGNKLFEKIMEEGVKKFKLKIVVLNVFKSNKIAQNLYGKNGFKKVGEIKNEVQYYGKYDDSIMMVKYIK